MEWETKGNPDSPDPNVFPTITSDTWVKLKVRARNDSAFPFLLAHPINCHNKNSKNKRIQLISLPYSSILIKLRLCATNLNNYAIICVRSLYCIDEIWRRSKIFKKREQNVWLSESKTFERHAKLAWLGRIWSCRARITEWSTVHNNKSPSWQLIPGAERNWQRVLIFLIKAFNLWVKIELKIFAPTPMSLMPHHSFGLDEYLLFRIGTSCLHAIHQITFNIPEVSYKFNQKI